MADESGLKDQGIVLEDLAHVVGWHLQPCQQLNAKVLF